MLAVTSREPRWCAHAGRNVRFHRMGMYIMSPSMICTRTAAFSRRVMTRPDSTVAHPGSSPVACYSRHAFFWNTLTACNARVWAPIPPRFSGVLRSDGSPVTSSRLSRPPHGTHMLQSADNEASPFPRRISTGFLEYMPICDTSSDGHAALDDACHPVCARSHRPTLAACGAHSGVPKTPNRRSGGSPRWNSCQVPSCGAKFATVMGVRTAS